METFPWTIKAEFAYRVCVFKFSSEASFLYKYRQYSLTYRYIFMSASMYRDCFNRQVLQHRLKGIRVLLMYIFSTRIEAYRLQAHNKPHLRQILGILLTLCSLIQSSNGLYRYSFFSILRYIAMGNILWGNFPSFQNPSFRQNPYNCT
jgi:hypothetical protein